MRHVEGSKKMKVRHKKVFGFLFSYISCYFSCHNLITVVSKIEMQMGKQVCFTSFNFSNNQIFIGSVTDVSPHGQIFYEHFKEIVVMDRIL